MKNDKVSRTDEIRHRLADHGENCLRLAEKLGDQGEPLNPDEKRLIRMATLPMLQDQFDMALGPYLARGIFDPDFHMVNEE